MEENYQQEYMKNFQTKDKSFQIKRSECPKQLILKRSMSGPIIMKSQRVDRHKPESGGKQVQRIRHYNSIGHPNSITRNWKKVEQRP